MRGRLRLLVCVVWVWWLKGLFVVLWVCWGLDAFRKWSVSIDLQYTLENLGGDQIFLG